MSYYQFDLTAGVPHIVDAPGSIILIDSIGVAQGIDVTPIYRGGEDKKMPNRQAAFKYVVPFDAVKFQSATDTTMSVFLTNNEVSLGFANGAAVNVLGSVSVTNDVAHAVPVSVTGGVTLTATNVGINNNNAAAVPVKKQALSTLVDYAPVSIPGIVAISLINDAALRRLIFRNSHATAIICIGGSSVSLANSPIRLLPGDVYMEDDAAGAHWYAITDTPGATLQLQGVEL